MRSSRLVLLCTSCFALAACEPDNHAEPTLLSTRVASPFRGPRTPISERQYMRIQVLEGAPANFRDSLFTIGAAYVSVPHAMRPVRVSASREVVRRIKAVRWLRVLSVDSTTRLGPTSQAIPWGADSIGARYVNSTHNITGTGIKVLVVDDGIACSHPDLTVWGGYDFVEESTTYCGVDGVHGTRVAGVIAALDNSAYAVGVAPGAKIYSARICEISGSTTSCEVNLAIDALGWALSYGMDVVSVSLATCEGNVNWDWNDAVDDLYAAGVPVVVSHGKNDVCGSEDGPSILALSPQAVVVAGHNPDQSYLNVYQYSYQVDFSAPAVVLSVGVGGDTATIGGVSSAVPHVAGLFALLKSAGFSGVSSMSTRIAQTAIDAGASGPDPYYGNGLIRADAAATPKPSITNLSWCTTSGIEVAGNCSMTATTANGAGGNSVRFVTYFSNSPNDSTVYDYGSATRNIYVPAGNYELAIKTRARDAYGRYAVITNTWTIPVCTEPSATTCGGGGEEQ